MRQVLATLQLIRTVNCLLAMVGVWIGAYMTWSAPIWLDPLLAGLVAFLVCAAGNIINDRLDIEIDRVNHPRRVLVQGKLSIRFAARLAIVLNVVALAIALLVNYLVFLVALAALGLLMAYNFYLKRIPLLGNLIIAVLGGLTFITGGLAVDVVATASLPGPLIPAVYALLFHLVREIVKDVQDIDGDRAAGLTTFPMVAGVRTALLTALLLFLVLVLLTYVPIVAGWFGYWYRVITVYVVDLPILALLILVWGNPTRNMLAIGSNVLKVGMALGVVALLLA